MKECIVLAGGLGTRLQSVVSDVPKCMAEVAGRPFLSYLFDYLAREKFDSIILSLGYKAEVVLDWIKNNEYPFNISFTVETEPLGTGGAIKLAFQQATANNIFVINGDTFFDVDTENLLAFHTNKQAGLSLALKPMLKFDRYGSVELSLDKRITEFKEKAYCDKGLINGGVYLINSNIFAGKNLPNKFSFEKEIMENGVSELPIYGLEFDNYFIDIGIPFDFEKAKIDFKAKEM